MRKTSLYPRHIWTLYTLEPLHGGAKRAGFNYRQFKVPVQVKQRTSLLHVVNEHLSRCTPNLRRSVAKTQQHSAQNCITVLDMSTISVPSQKFRVNRAPTRALGPVVKSQDSQYILTLPKYPDIESL